MGTENSSGEPTPAAGGTPEQPNPATGTPPDGETPPVGDPSSTQTPAAPAATGTAGESTEGATTPPAANADEATFNKEALLADLHKERESRKALRAQVDALNAELTTAKEAPTQLAAVQRKYDRLEAFLLGVGGPLRQMLDSRTFSTALFETDTDIKDLVAQWNKENPSATSAALGGASADPGGSKPDINALLRAAAQ